MISNHSLQIALFLLLFELFRQFIEEILIILHLLVKRENFFWDHQFDFFDLLKGFLVLTSEFIQFTFILLDLIPNFFIFRKLFDSKDCLCNILLCNML